MTLFDLTVQLKGEWQRRTFAARMSQQTADWLESDEGQAAVRKRIDTIIRLGAAMELAGICMKRQS